MGCLFAREPVGLFHTTEVVMARPTLSEVLNNPALRVLCTPKPRTVACPCCQHVTLTEQAGFEICSVCFWEDDGNRRFLDIVSTVNRMTLAEGRRNYAACGAHAAEFLPYVVSLEEFQRRVANGEE